MKSHLDKTNTLRRHVQLRYRMGLPLKLTLKAGHGDECSIRLLMFEMDGLDKAMFIANYHPQGDSSFVSLVRVIRSFHCSRERRKTEISMDSVAVRITMKRA